MKIEQVIGNAQTIGISGHERPDGDCIGSCMGMYLYLKKVYPKARIDVFLENIPDIYRFIPGTDIVCTNYQSDIQHYDAFLILDTSKERTLGAEEYFDNAKLKINIDHHISNPGDGDWNYIYPNTSSASELAYELMTNDYIDRDIAMTLYSGIISDTGVFKYSDTSPRTLNIAGDLISYGFDFNSLIDHVFYERTFKQNKLLAQALMDAELMLDGKCIVSVTDLDTIRKYHAIPCDLEGIVSQMQLTTDVDCSVYLHQLSADEYKISLRSNGNVDVAKVAVTFEGGGHARAAGATMKGTSEEIIKKITDKISEAYNK